MSSPSPSPRGAVALAVAAAAASLMVTLPRMARGLVVLGDSAELVAAARCWGVAHPPGYALYVAVAHLFASVPLGPLPMRVHALSALAHAAATACVALAAARVARSAVAGVAAAALLVFSRAFLLGSLYAEVFAPNDALFAAALLVALTIHERHERPESPPPRSRGHATSTALMVLVGVAVAHHLMAVLAAPALAIVAGPSLREEHARSRRAVVRWAAALALPTVLAALLVVAAASRDPAVSYGDVHDLPSLASQLLRLDYGGPWSSNLQPTTEPLGERIGALALLLFDSFGPGGVLLALLGAVLLARRDARSALALMVAFLATGPLFAAANRLTTETEAELSFFERFTTMAHVPLSILAGAGCALLLERLPRRWRFRRPLATALALAPGLALAPAALTVSLAHDRSGDALAHDLVEGVPEGALVLVSGDQLTAAAHYVVASGLAPEGVVYAAPGQLFMPWKRRQHDRRHGDVPLPGPRMSGALTYELVDAQLDRRPVFVTEPVVARDERLSEQLVPVPLGLLSRMYRTKPLADVHAAETLERLRAIQRREACRGCALDPAKTLHPSEHTHVLDLYGAALGGTAHVAFVLHDVPLALDLGRRSMVLGLASGAVVRRSGAH